jgi:NAD(P)-dependent dehydrogenase (short-subunit alcohol dehydrogenase family)
MARVVIVTGGSGALGQAIVHRFLEEGATVCVPWIVEQERERLHASVEAAARARLRLERCDVLDDGAVERLVRDLTERHGRIDVVVSAVGGFAMGELVQTDRALWDRMLTLNLSSTYVAARAALPAMLTAGSGRIVAVASRAVVPPAGGFIAYTVANRAAMPDADPKSWVPVQSVADAVGYLAAESSAHVTGSLLAI